MPTIPSAEIEAGAKALREQSTPTSRIPWRKVAPHIQECWRRDARIVLTAAALVREQDNG